MSHIRPLSRLLALGVAAALTVAAPVAHAGPDSPDAHLPGSSGAALEPLAWEGPAPDPDQVPEEWTRATPAEQIEPSSVSELMDPDTGYLAQFGETVPASVPAPPTKDLPPTLDAAPGFQFAYSCDPNDKPGMLAFAQLVTTHYDRPQHSTSRPCVLGSTSKHGDGRALDWMMNAYNASDKAIGDAAAQWLTANNGEIARRFGVMSIIWNRRVWYIWDPGNWRTYTGASPHTDHLHISFTWDGAMGRTSWWTGVPVTDVDQGTCRVYSGQYAPRYTTPTYTECPGDLPAAPYAPYPVTLPGWSNSNVAVAQQHLGFTGSAVDGVFGAGTLSALLDYQDSHDVPWTGVLDKATWAKMLQVGIPDPAPEPDPEPAPVPDGVERVAGIDRYHTAALLAGAFQPGRHAYVALGTDFPDALAAAALAGHQDAPVLLAKNDTLPSATRSALTTLQPSGITVVGDSGAVSDTVMTELEAYTTGSVDRAGGSDRYATSAQVALRFDGPVPVAFVAVGADYADALAGSARAATDGGPVLLTRSDLLPASVVGALEDLDPHRIVVVGDEGAVSSTVMSALGDLAGGGGVQRIAGADRYETSAAVSDLYPAGVPRAVVATGLEFPDALAGSAVAGSRGGPLLMVRTSTIPPAVRSALSRLDPGSITALGGEDRIEHDVLIGLGDYVG